MIVVALVLASLLLAVAVFTSFATRTIKGSQLTSYLKDPSEPPRVENVIEVDNKISEWESVSERVANLHKQMETEFKK